MGYFSNSTEGLIYEETYCRDCVHYQNEPHEAGCAVWDVHFLYNYDQEGSPDLHAALNMLIPEREDEPGNEECRMRYVEGSKEDDV